jgi:hypothetical protein
MQCLFVCVEVAQLLKKLATGFNFRQGESDTDHSYSSNGDDNVVSLICIAAVGTGATFLLCRI